MREKTFENRLVEAFRKKGAYATHIDCYTPGFPDIYILDKGQVHQVEVKVADLDSRICDIFEPSQPVFYHEALKRGVAFFIVVYLEDTKFVRTYMSEQILKAFLDDRSQKVRRILAMYNGDVKSTVDWILS